MKKFFADLFIFFSFLFMSFQSVASNKEIAFSLYNEIGTGRSQEAHPVVKSFFAGAMLLSGSIVAPIPLYGYKLNEIEDEVLVEILKTADYGKNLRRVHTFIVHWNPEASYILTNSHRTKEFRANQNLEYVSSDKILKAWEKFKTIKEFSDNVYLATPRSLKSDVTSAENREFIMTHVNEN